jgi:hypothetical protein
MVKVIILLRGGADADARYNDFLMKLEAMPGVRRKTVSTVYGARDGKIPYTAVVEVTFESRAALEAGLTSEAGIAAGRLLAAFAGPDALVLYADTLEEAFDASPLEPGDGA